MMGHRQRKDMPDERQGDWNSMTGGDFLTVKKQPGVVCQTNIVAQYRTAESSVDKDRQFELDSL